MRKRHAGRRRADCCHADLDDRGCRARNPDRCPAFLVRSLSWSVASATDVLAHR